MFDLISYCLLIMLILFGIYVLARDIVSRIGSDKTLLAVALASGFLYIALSWSLRLNIDLVYLLVVILGSLFIAEKFSK